MILLIVIYNVLNLEWHVENQRINLKLGDIEPRSIQKSEMVFYYQIRIFLMGAE